MKKILLALLVAIFHLSWSQVTISGNHLMKNGETYALKDYEKVFNKTDSKELFRKARAQATTATILGGIGGFGLGFGLAQAMASGDKQTAGYGYFLIGGALATGIAIPIYISANKKAKKAIEIENGTDTAFRPYFKVGSSGTSIALSYNF